MIHRSPPAPSNPISDSSLFQNAFYVGINIENILYGIELLLYFKTAGILLSKKGVHKRSNLAYALFSSMMVILITIWVAAQAIFGEQMWLLDSDYPGGPGAYWGTNVSIWYMDWGMTAVIVLQLMTDGLMIYRCRIIWNSYCAIIIPGILWLSTLVLGVMIDWSSSSPGGNFFVCVASRYGLPYYTVSVFLTVMLTCMICYRIVRHGKQVQEHLGHEYASPYFAIVTLVVESVLPYTLSGIAFLVSLGLGSPTSVAFMCVYYLMMCISPQLLILRVLTKSVWDINGSRQPESTIHFSPGVSSELQWRDSNGTRVHVRTLSRVYLPDGQGKVKILPV